MKPKILNWRERQRERGLILMADLQIYATTVAIEVITTPPKYLDQPIWVFSKVDGLNYYTSLLLITHRGLDPLLNVSKMLQICSI